MSSDRSGYEGKTREQWEAFAAEMATWPLNKAIETIADMGEQVDMLHAARLASWGGQLPSSRSDHSTPEEGR